MDVVVDTRTDMEEILSPKERTRFLVFQGYM